MINYIVDLIFATRNPAQYGMRELKPLIKHGASPRGTLTVHYAARALAILRGRHFVTPDDVKSIIFDALRHRVLLSYEAEVDNITADKIIERILEVVPSP